MFREMRRFKQEIHREECVKLLNNSVRGVLSLCGDDGYPYGVPINFWYSEKENKIFFHGAKTGHKIDAIDRCDKASFCIYDEGYRKEGQWALNIKSVIVFGRIKKVNDYAMVEKISRNLCSKFTEDSSYADYELKHNGKTVQCLELDIEHMTGKLVEES